jgi:hypothetical protein
VLRVTCLLAGVLVEHTDAACFCSASRLVSARLRWQVVLLDILHAKLPTKYIYELWTAPWDVQHR